KSLPTINWLQTIGSLGRQHPPWILGGKSADLIQLPKLVLGECDFDRSKIVLKLVEAFRANDDRGYHRLCQEPCEREACGAASMCFGDRSHHIEDLPGSLFVHEGKVELGAARIRGLLVRPAELAGKQAAGQRTPHEQADLFGFEHGNDVSFEIAAGDRVISLKRVESGQVPQFGDAEGFGDLPCLQVGAADVSDLTLSDESIERAQSLFDRSDIVVSVDLVQVNMVSLQKAKTGLHAV